MMSVALMSDPGVSKGARKESEALTWGKPRLGQMTILLELIGRLRGIRSENEGKRGNSAVSWWIILKHGQNIILTHPQR